MASTFEALNSQPIMNRLVVVVLLLTLIVGALSIWSLALTRKQADRIAELEARLNPATDDDHSTEHGHESILVVGMGRMQVYADKLYFAGKAGNSALVEFYLHEIEEVMEEIAEAEITDEGHDISNYMKQMGLSTHEGLETSKVLLDVAGFDQAYLTLVNACNGCHAVTDHAMIKIQVPERPALTNQNYLP